jgi:hypothetical protein
MHPSVPGAGKNEPLFSSPPDAIDQVVDKVFPFPEKSAEFPVVRIHDLDSEVVAISFQNRHKLFFLIWRQLEF